MSPLDPYLNSAHLSRSMLTRRHGCGLCGTQWLPKQASSPEGFWLDGYDIASLRARVLTPLGPAAHSATSPRVTTWSVTSISTLRCNVLSPAPSSSWTDSSCTATSSSVSGTCLLYT